MPYHRGRPSYSGIVAHIIASLGTDHGLLFCAARLFDAVNGVLTRTEYLDVAPIVAATFSTCEATV